MPCKATPLCQQDCSPHCIPIGFEVMSVGCIAIYTLLFLMPGALYRGVIALSPPRGLCSTSALWLCAQKYLIQHPWLLLELPLGQVPCSPALMLCHIPAPFKWNLTGYTYVACLHTAAPGGSAQSSGSSLGSVLFAFACGWKESCRSQWFSTHRQRWREEKAAPLCDR